MDSGAGGLEFVEMSFGSTLARLWNLFVDMSCDIGLAYKHCQADLATSKIGHASWVSALCKRDFLPLALHDCPGQPRCL